MVQFPHFSSKRTKADRSEMTCPRTNGPCVAGVEFKPGSLSLVLLIRHLLRGTQVLVFTHNELGHQPSRVVFKTLCFDNIPTLSPPSLKSPMNLPLWEDHKIKSSRSNSRKALTRKNSLVEPESRVPYAISVCLAKSSALSIGETILSTVRKAARLAV